MPDSCMTFTHHVGDDLRAECAQHPDWIVDVPKQPKGQPSAREIITAARHEHEEKRQ